MSTPQNLFFWRNKKYFIDTLSSLVLCVYSLIRKNINTFWLKRCLSKSYELETVKKFLRT